MIWRRRSTRVSVTVRRLNRNEYNNTIRDLLGVDSGPAEDFPSDDVGQGFDNIGDVLSISPVLMERYMAAAENVMQLALPMEPLRPALHHVNGRFMEPAIREAFAGKAASTPAVGKHLTRRMQLPDRRDLHLRGRSIPIMRTPKAPADRGAAGGSQADRPFEVIAGRSQKADGA